MPSLARETKKETPVLGPLRERRGVQSVAPPSAHADGDAGARAPRRQRAQNVAPGHNITESRFGRVLQAGAEAREPAGREETARARQLESTREPLTAALAIPESTLVDGHGAGAAGRSEERRVGKECRAGG